jgi:hypothetical protein
MNIRPLFLFRSLYLRRARDAAFAEPLVAQREMIVADDPADASTVRRPDNPITMSDVENTISHPARVRGHTDQALGELLGLSAEQAADLRAKGAEKRRPFAPLLPLSNSRSISCSRGCALMPFPTILPIATSSRRL